MKAAIVTRTNALARPVHSSQQVHEERTEIGLVLEVDGRFGVGTVSPQPAAVLGDPSHSDVLATVHERGLGRLGAVGRTAVGRNWAQVHGFFGDAPQDRWTASLVESAVLDLDCAESGRTWSEVFGDGDSSYQAVTSLLSGSIQVNEIAARYRVKVAAGAQLDFSSLSKLTKPVLLDFNGDTISQVELESLVERASVHAEIVGVEQAWPVGDYTTPAAMRRGGLRLSHDESLRSVGDLRNAIRYESIDIAAIKPARCGGLAVARDMARRSKDAGLEVYIGGFFEGPLGRFRNHLLASSLSAGPSDVLHTSTGLPVTSAQAEVDRFDWIDRAERLGDWLEVGG